MNNVNQHDSDTILLTKSHVASSKRHVIVIILMNVGLIIVIIPRTAQPAFNNVSINNTDSASQIEVHTREPLKFPRHVDNRFSIERHFNKLFNS